MGDMIEVKVPDIGDYKDVPVIEILVKSGDSVRLEDPLVTLESDKATMDVPAPHPGTIKDIKVKIGDKVSEGVVVLMLETVSVGAVGKIHSRCCSVRADVCEWRDGACESFSAAFRT